MKGSVAIFVLAIFIPCWVQWASALNLEVASNDGNTTNPLLHGIMYEDINRSGDGGLYAELIQNRAFQGTTQTTGYVAVNSELSVDSSTPLSSALPNSMKVVGTSTTTGFSNTGYFGISVTAVAYNGSFYVKGDYSGDFTVSLQSSDGGTTFASETVTGGSSASSWTQHTYILRPSDAAPNVDNVLTVTFDGTKATDGTLWFSLISLFPPTYHDRPNGLRIDIAEGLEELGLSYLRFPGGNNLEGNTGGPRWKWNETIGDLIDRPGRPGTWGYENTDGLGLVEYMQWTTDMKLEPILAIWAGFYLSGPVISEADIGIYVDDALAELEFLMGDTSTPGGALRASLGFPEPWKINYVEIGNEDNLGGGLNSYNAYRFSAFNDAIKQAYPDMTVIASTTALSPAPEGAWLDFHTYTNPDQMAAMFNLFDHASRDHPTIVGEFAVTSAGGSSLQFSTLEAAVAEAVFMIGLQRNADVIMGASYAPVLENINAVQWTPDLYDFTADPADNVRSMSYYAQKIFSLNRGDVTLPLTSDSAFGPLYWTAARSTDSTEYVFKVVSYKGTAAQTVTIASPSTSFTAARLTTFTAPSPQSFNSPGNETSVWTESTLTKNSAGAFEFTLDAYGVAVLVVS